MWRDVKHPKTGRLLFRVDMERMIVQIQERGEKVTVDLLEHCAKECEPEQSKGRDLHPTKLVVR